MDMKRYDCENGTYAVSVVETLTPLALLLRKEDLLRALREIKHSEGLQYLIFCVVDLVVLQSYMFAISAAEQSLIEQFLQHVEETYTTHFVFTACLRHTPQAFGLSDVRDIGEAYTLTAVSRKKQIVPALEKAIATVRDAREIGEVYTLTAVSRKKQIVPALEKAIAPVRGMSDDEPASECNKGSRLRDHGKSGEAVSARLCAELMSTGNCSNVVALGYLWLFYYYFKLKKHSTVVCDWAAVSLAAHFDLWHEQK
ncbi:hypothetical protein SARC_00750 [Sphaeroforma arctica JP610]|uniref:DHHA2 domain-containing protein n=1 Tax=Sphaeroforma arctica JP610 TaxID=667725 RepID=A0A0L0GDP6_9EUKA|nr:hypothetical protein SARC_00750 [Sphaeroforma arctica JP610]KNC87127.1 hypothetical protein SARC_00750 [Sphaeroforma arctica JP610]|eukprot:XP_014161029.1 hypothetical protein SARC_00750 [Sphaeroforma arctica JP610]